MMVTDTSGHHLVNRENIEQVGKFAFTTDKDDIFEICFISRVPSNMRGARQEVIITANQRPVFGSRDQSRPIRGPCTDVHSITGFVSGQPHH